MYLSLFHTLSVVIHLCQTAVVPPFLSCHMLCRFFLVTGITRSTFYMKLGLYRAGHSLTSLPRLPRIRGAAKGDSFTAWLRNWADSVADKMPDRQVQVLPCTDFHTVYLEYVADLTQRNDSHRIVSEAHARRLFHSTENSDILLHREKGAFATCDICASYRSQLQGSLDVATGEKHKRPTVADREVTRQQYQAHLRFQAEERRVYQQHIDLVRGACLGIYLLCTSLIESL